MNEPAPQIDSLIDTLTRELRPVRHVRAPLMRGAVWLALVAAAGAVMALVANLGALGHRLAASPDMWLAVTGSALTAITAAIAAFNLSLPDRPARWAWLPLPAMVLWVAASGAGCLRTAVPLSTGGFLKSLDCLVFVVGVSLPLSAILVVMLRRGYALRPGLAALCSGLAAAAAAATLLNFFHPFDATAADMLVHLTAVVLVVAAISALGTRLLQAPAR